MKTIKYASCLLLISFFITLSSFGQKGTIVSGVHWYDNNRNVVSAHGGGITKDGDRYYLFGEFKSDTSNAFVGFSCYSSTDLCNWKFESIALALQDSGLLGPNRVGERPKVMKCPQTGEYIMFMHSDDIRYKDQRVAYATCNRIDGEYTFQGPLLFNGNSIRKWDMGVFQDDDGSGYIITHSGNLYKLSEDYKSISEQVVHNMTGQCEAPAIFKKYSIYFWLGSGLTGWERNDNYYFTAKSIKGPWVRKGLFAPKGSLTWNSQTTFVLPIMGSDDTTFMFMGDRCAYPKQNSAATYVWQPLSVVGDSIYLSEYIESWQIDLDEGTWSKALINGSVIEHSNKSQIKYSDGWIGSTAEDQFSHSRTDKKGAALSFSFKGTQIGMYSVAMPDGGFARFELQDSMGNTIISTVIEMYCLYPESSLKFLSPVLEKGKYTLILTNLGEHGNWTTKKGITYGSTGNFISVDKLIVIE